MNTSYLICDNFSLLWGVIFHNFYFSPSLSGPLSHQLYICMFRFTRRSSFVSLASLTRVSIFLPLSPGDTERQAERGVRRMPRVYSLSECLFISWIIRSLCLIRFHNRTIERKEWERERMETRRSGCEEQDDEWKKGSATAREREREGSVVWRRERGKKEYARHRCRSVKRTGIQGPKGQPRVTTVAVFMLHQVMQWDRKTRAACHPVQMVNLSLNTTRTRSERETQTHAYSRNRQCDWGRERRRKGSVRVRWR